MNQAKEELRGMVLRLERSSIHDGPGFRTVVFLKGCPLRCQWCSTPEAQSFQVEQAEGNITYGKPMRVEEVMKEVRKDSAFYFMSGGGMTLSGGEILSQPEFALALLKASCSELINTAIETTLFAPWDAIEPLFAYTYTAFVDFKLFDPALHKQYVGVDNKIILENLKRTNDVKESFDLIVRIPIIPGINDNAKELEAIGQFCAGLRRLSHVQLLPYHRLGTDTYRKLGRPYLLPDILAPSREEMERCVELVGKHVKTIL